MASSLNSALDKVDDTIDDDQLPIWQPGQSLSHILGHDAATDITYRIALADLQGLLAVAALPVPLAPTFTSFQDTQAGGSVVLVPAAGTVLADYVYKVLATGTYAPVPADGVLTVGNVAGSVYAYALATNTHAAGPVAVSTAFTTYTATQPAPQFAFAAIGKKAVGDADATLSATSSNTLTPITFASSNSNVVSVSGTTLTVVGPGTATITATQAAGNGYAAVTATQTVTVTAQALPAPVITFGPLKARTVGDGAFELNATSTNTVTAITYTSSDTSVVTVAQTGNGWKATPVGAGTATITATQAAGNGYGAGNNPQQLTVNAAPPAYNITLSATLPTNSPGTDQGIVFSPASTQRLRFIGNPNTAGNTLSLQITDSSDNSVSYVSFPDDYKNTPFAFDRADGTTYTGNFPDTDLNFTA